jgi:hypothetical protein
MLRKVAVMGGGGGAHTMAADLALRGIILVKEHNHVGLL